MTKTYVLPLSDTEAGLETAGGKGASLARLAGAGLPVPEGFHVTTAAYRAFVVANHLQPVILEALQSIDIAQVATIEAAAQAIQARFLQGEAPVEIVLAITDAYTQHMDGWLPTAVRSSATAEDLPEASFAGQQDTFLNIRGAGAVLEAVQRCWASLWTARAIAYRAKNQVDQAAVSLAVVVQKLVFADAAGVLFTTNPLNGRRSEMLINAAWGLGEAVVSGAVTPDTLIVEKAAGKVLQRTTAEKRVMTVRTENGVVEEAVPEARKNAPVLTNGQAAELAALGNRIEALYGMPMDVEWALEQGRFAILQARPITSLPPEWNRPNPKAMYARGSLAEHLPNPVTPLFGTLGLGAFNEATSVLAEGFGFNAEQAEYQYRAINGYVFMGFVTSPGIFWKMTKAGVSAWADMLKNSKNRWLAARERLLARLESWERRDAEAISSLELLQGVDEMMAEVARLYTVLQATTLPAASSSEMVFARLYRLARRKGDPEPTAFLFGFDTEPLQAEKALFDLAVWAQQRPALANALRRLPAADLAGGPPPQVVPAEDWEAWLDQFNQYLSTYGATIYELDFSNPTPAETPGVALEAIKMYLNGQGQNPYERQRAAAQARVLAEQQVLARLRWPMKGWLRKALRWAQDAGPVREDSLADLGRANPSIRRLLGALGRRLCAGGDKAGAINTAEDIYWLEEREVRQLIDLLETSQPLPELRERVAERKVKWQAQMKLTPPAMLPETSRWAKMMPWHRTDQGGQVLKGFGASAGKATGPACVLLGPADFSRMTPGAVLVAVTTTPAWTPLFAMASAVVTDIGGPLSHSSIVAREYGIPAVMATGLATRKIQDGQQITVDGSEGLVILQTNGTGHNGQAA